jgi:hypothetical protein
MLPTAAFSSISDDGEFCILLSRDVYTVYASYVSLSSSHVAVEGELISYVSALGGDKAEQGGVTEHYVLAYVNRAGRSAPVYNAIEPPTTS